jgi:two-component system, chemotaxis family, chemotaxis protein CheY
MTATSTSLPSATPKRFLRILYADDVRELRDVARISFSRDGHGIECLADGELALNRLIEDSTFDLVITDHHMPNMNGLELVRRLRELAYPGKIMVFSSELSPTVEEEYKRLQVDRILYKPVYPAMLREILAELFPGAMRAPHPASVPANAAVAAAAS